MERRVLIILMNLRKKSAPTVQKILTEWGCIIKTRLGIHDGVLENCSDTGMIILELAGEKEKHQELSRKLELLDGVSTKLIEISVD